MDDYKFKSPLDYLSQGLDASNDVASRAKAAALAALQGSNPVDAIRNNERATGKEVAQGLFNRLDPAINVQGAQVKPAGASLEPLSGAAGFAADMAIDPANLIPGAKIAAMGALATKGIGKGLKLANKADEAAKISHSLAKHSDFHSALNKARGVDPRIQEYTHLYSPEEYAAMKTFLAPDGMSGFAVKSDGDIVSAFNAARGGGRLDDIMNTAFQHGGKKLDAFDKKPGEIKGLPDLYKKYGFKEVKREPNWTPGGPDVVYMERMLEEAAQQPSKFDKIKQMFQVDGKVFPADSTAQAMDIHNALKATGQVSPTSTLVDLQNQKPFKSSR